MSETYPGDDFVPIEFRDMEHLDTKQANEFDRWFSKRFHFDSAFQIDPELYSVTPETCEKLVARAFALHKWLEMQAVVRRYLLDDRYEISFDIG